jgi:hypothetical protein
VHWVDQGVALPKGSIIEQDLTVETGCAYADNQGCHHILYTGINPYFNTTCIKSRLCYMPPSPISSMGRKFEI